MLTGDLVRGRVHRGKLRLALVDPDNSDLQDLSARLVAVFTLAPGCSREDIQSAVESACEGPVHPVVAKGLAHLLWKRCETSAPPGPDAATLRSVVFRAAATARKEGTTPFPRETILAECGGPLGLDPAGVERALFSDLPSEEIIRSFEPIQAEQLIFEYNLALIQGALLRSTRVVLTLGRPRPEALRSIFRAARFHRLLVSTRRPTPGRVELAVDGPANLLEEIVKHGMQLACFIPWAMCQPKYHLAAEILWGPRRTPCLLEFTHLAGIKCVVPAPVSGPPRELLAFASLFTREAAGWTIDHEAEPVELDDGYWVPDLKLIRSSDGKIVYFDFITRGKPQSVASHLRRLSRQKKWVWLVAASQTLLAEPVHEAAGRLIPFKSIPLVETVVSRAEHLVDAPSGGP